MFVALDSKLGLAAHTALIRCSHRFSYDRPRNAVDGALTGKMSFLMDEAPKMLSGKNALVIGGGGGIGRAIT